MSAYLLLLSPRFKSAMNRLRRNEDGSTLRLIATGAFALGFWVAIFVAFFKVLGYFQAAEGFGDVLARKLMGMIWLTFLAVLAFSNVVTSLSTFFLSKDLDIIHSSPVPRENIFWARMTDTLIDSSWMVVFFGLPVFLAYGIVYSAGILYYVKILAVTAPLLVIATSMAVIFVLVLVNVFPAQRSKDILFLLGVAAVIFLYLLFRFMRPEKLVNPDAFSSMVGYFAALNTPSSPYLPSYWAGEVLWPSLQGSGYSEAGFYLLLLWATAAGIAVVASWFCAALYAYGYSKSQEGARRFVPRYNPLEVLIWLLSRPLGTPSRVLIAKDLRTFFRDNTQWSQLLLLLALIVIYLYNFSVLDLRKSPIQTFYLQNVISFLNIGLAAFVTASLGVRFVFPAVSQEGFSYWIIRSSPLSPRRFLWTKFWIYLPPLLIVAEVLVVMSNRLLNVTPFMMGLSTLTILFVAPALVGLGVGLGAVYPRFETENIAQVATGFGGMVYMIVSAFYVAAIVVLEAWPVYTVLRSMGRGYEISGLKIALIIVCFVAVISLNAAMTILPMRYGLRKLLAREGA